MSEHKFRGVQPHKDGGWAVFIGHEVKKAYQFASPNAKEAE